MPKFLDALPTAACALAAALMAGCATSPAPEIQSAATAAPVAPPAEPEPDDAADFAQWKQAFAAKARAAGISENTVRMALLDLRQQRIVHLDRGQPEFTRTPWQYLDSAVSAQRIKNGRAKMKQYARQLDAASERYEVPAAVIAAIWGMESNYGSNFGNFPVIDALATLAFDGRRTAWAESELIAALRIIDDGHIPPAYMIGSWAGAMGHTQFLPSVYLQHAVDADGDGRRDIWGSIADVTASTANYLANSGWTPNEPWGLEVRLPESFDYARAELTTRQNSSAWAAQGVQALDGQPLPVMAGASIIVPAGARGPAFLVGTNFRTLLRYNNSVNYALGVGLLAQQLNGGGGVQTAWPRELAPLSREQMQTLQSALNARGFDAGSADGIIGPATRAGLRRYQQSLGLTADGYPTLELLQSLQASP